VRTRYVSVVAAPGGTGSDHVAVEDELFAYGDDDLRMVQSPGMGSTTTTFWAICLALRSTI
jgi:hypothetical protein